MHRREILALGATSIALATAASVGGFNIGHRDTATESAALMANIDTPDAAPRGETLLMATDLVDRLAARYREFQATSTEQWTAAIAFSGDFPGLDDLASRLGVPPIAGGAPSPLNHHLIVVRDEDGGRGSYDLLAILGAAMRERHGA